MPGSILQTVPLGMQWPTVDPFLFCAHHDDAYPPGNPSFGPAASLAGRQLGQDFGRLDGWSMYHGRVVPGFPQHPHRGFETVTFVRRGLVDHADSLGAAARYGHGDVQWMTAGSGIVHAEMFPLLDAERSNPLQIFQIWLNLPAASKMVAPHFSMLWADSLARLVERDERGRSATLTVIAGPLDGAASPPPPPDSWAARADADVAIWHLHLDAGARMVLPAARHPDTVRTLYSFEGPALTVDGERVEAGHAALVDSTRRLELIAGAAATELLVLAGRPIGEPVAQYGPFVMNTRAEISQAFDDYRSTGFGGWPWPEDAPVHGAEPRRFARHADGRVEYADTAVH